MKKIEIKEKQDNRKRQIETEIIGMLKDLIIIEKVKFVYFDRCIIFYWKWEQFTNKVNFENKFRNYY